MSSTVNRLMINSQSDQARLATRLTAAAGVLGRTLRLWGARIKERHAFPIVDERDLRDLRITRWELERELAKPFWKG